MVLVAQVENVECKEDGHITFDFLGKDSIKYANTVEVDPRVYELVKSFCKGEGRKGRRCLFKALKAAAKSILH